MTRTAIIFGGKSCEHDVSIVTGVQMLCGAVEHDLLPIYIDREGVWRTGGDMKSLETYRRPERMKRVHMRPAGARCTANTAGVWRSWTPLFCAVTARAERTAVCKAFWSCADCRTRARTC